MEIYERSVTLPHAVEEIFAWMESPSAYFRYLPPWQRIETLEKVGTIRDGDHVTFRVRFGPLAIRQTLEHEDYKPLEEYGDRQTTGPHRFWSHRHYFRPAGESSCEMTDRIYCEPSAIVGLLGKKSLRRTVEYIFEWTQERVRRDLERHASGPKDPLRVLMAGASGLLGTTLAEFVGGGGHEIAKLVQRASGLPSEILWDPGSRSIDPAALEGFDAVIHLAGENIGAKRWTAERRKLIRERHVADVELLCGALARLKDPPAVLVSASPVGIYGNAENGVDETASAGQSFLAEVANAWERATESAQDAGIRVVHARLGEVLTLGGGLLKRVLPAFRLGAGGVVGNGRQSISWIGMEDAIGALFFLTTNEEARGRINLVAPKPATNREFARTLAKVLQRPAFAPVPALAIRTLYGEMGDQLILRGRAVVPERLDGLGFAWLDPTLEGALRWELGKTATD